MPTTSEGCKVPCAPDKPKDGSFKHKNRVLSPVNSGNNLVQLGSIESVKRVNFSISIDVHYIDASSKEQIDTYPFSRRHQRRQTKEKYDCFDSDEDLDVFHDEPVLDLSVFHRQ